MRNVTERLGRVVPAGAAFLAVSLLQQGCRESFDGAMLDGLELQSTAGGVCPTPGPLPFTTQTETFANPDTVETTQANPFPTHGGQDMLAGERSLNGNMSRASNFLLTQRPIQAEWVSFWMRQNGTWIEVGRTTTDSNGAYAFSLGAEPTLGTGTSSLFAVLEGDATCAVHGAFNWPSGTQVIITDIDGTLTLDDNELTDQIMGNPTYVPKQNASAAQMLQAWAAKGYFIVYVSARPHALRGVSRSWLHQVGAPFGPLHTADTFVYGESARTYKAAFIQRMKNDLGWQIIAAYGNAESDIQAYEDAGIPKEVTFIVGPEAGKSGTQPIGNNDFSEHLTYVQNQPSATQPF